jgi:hypothetical protein
VRPFLRIGRERMMLGRMPTGTDTARKDTCPGIAGAPTKATLPAWRTNENRPPAIREPEAHQVATAEHGA